MYCFTRKTNCFTRKTLVGANRVRIWYGNIHINNTVIKHKLYVINYTRNNIYVRRLQIEYTTRVLASM